MIDELLLTLGWEGVVGLFTGFCTVIGAGFHYLGVRLGERKGRAKEKAETDNLLVDSATKLATVLGERLDKVEVDLAACESRHEDCERRVDDLAGKVATLEEINKLMTGKVATYPNGGAKG